MRFLFTTPLFLSLLSLPAAAQCDRDELVKLTPQGAVSGALFGDSVAIDGDTIVVGAPLDGTSTASRPGRAYVYRRNGNAVQLVQRLSASNGQSFDYFGCAVAVAGDVAVVGAYRRGANAQGSVVVFRRGPGGWSQEAELVAPGGASGDRFGDDVATDGNLIVVGAQGADIVATAAGAAYLFGFEAGRWQLLATLTDPGGRVRDRFGCSVAVDDGLVAVGADLDDEGRTDNGAVHVFRETSPGRWTSTAKLVAPIRVDNGAFGQDVALRGRTLGVTGHVSGPEGVAYAFRFDGQTWRGANVSSGQNRAFGNGATVAVEENGVLLGNPLGHYNGGTSQTGLGNLHYWADGRFRQASRASSPRTSHGDQLGISVALDGNVGVMGATGDNGHTGAAYVFEFLCGSYHMREVSPGIAGQVNRFYVENAILSNESLLLVGATPGTLPILGWQPGQALDMLDPALLGTMPRSGGDRVLDVLVPGVLRGLRLYVQSAEPASELVSNRVEVRFQ